MHRAQLLPEVLHGEVRVALALERAHLLDGRQRDARAPRLATAVVDQPVIPVALPALLQPRHNLKTMVRRRGPAEAARGLDGPQAHGCAGAFYGSGRAQVLPVLGREVVEGEQPRAVLGQAGRGLVVLGAVGLQEEVERLLGPILGLGHPDVLPVPLGLGLEGLGQLVQHVAGLVQPAALFARRAVALAQGLPEAARSVADGQLGRHLEAAPLEIEQQLAPRLGALAIAGGDCQQFLAAPLVGADDDQDALFVVLHPGLEIDPVGPEYRESAGPRGRAFPSAPARLARHPSSA